MEKPLTEEEKNWILMNHTSGREKPFSLKEVLSALRGEDTCTKD